MIILGIFNTKKYVQVLKKAFIVFNYNLFMDKCMCSLNIEKAIISTLIKVSDNFSAKEHTSTTFANHGIWKYTTHQKPRGSGEII